MGIFAPGWTFEDISRLDIDINTRCGTDVTNRHFVERNHRFWALIWPTFYTRPYVKLPFHSTFCHGSGKQRYLEGALCEPARRFFQLDRQSLQPSVPQQHIDYNFDDSFSDGVSIKVTSGSELGPRRLFVVDWQLGVGLIVAYAYKAHVPEEDVCLWLRVLSPEGEVTRIKCCSAEEESSPNERTQDHRRVFPLKDDDLLDAIAHIESANEKSLPASAPNDWMIRYYNVTSEEGSPTDRVTDIGVGTHHGQGAYLGAVHVHRGFDTLNRRFSRRRL